jgi:hypothetical protein
MNSCYGRVHYIEQKRTLPIFTFTQRDIRLFKHMLFMFALFSCDWVLMHNHSSNQLNWGHTIRWGSWRIFPPKSFLGLSFFS